MVAAPPTGMMPEPYEECEELALKAIVTRRPVVMSANRMIGMERRPRPFGNTITPLIGYLADNLEATRDDCHAAHAVRTQRLANAEHAYQRPLPRRGGFN